MLHIILHIIVIFVNGIVSINVFIILKTISSIIKYIAIMTPFVLFMSNHFLYIFQILVSASNCINKIRSSNKYIYIYKYITRYDIENGNNEKFNIKINLNIKKENTKSIIYIYQYIDMYFEIHVMFGIFIKKFGKIYLTKNKYKKIIIVL